MQRAQTIRATKDVDVVAKVTTLADYHAVERAVEARGFKHDISPEAPICRWTRDGVILDLMPSEAVLGFHNRWYPLAVQTAARMTLPGNVSIRLITAPVFIATKLSAFQGRGNNDYLASHDLEDVITVIDGRKELLDEIRNSDSELRKYVGREIGRLLQESEFQLAMPGHLPGDAASQARLPELMRRLHAVAQLK